MTPKVYFTDFCTGTSETLPQKLARLIMSAGIDQIDFQNKFVAIKIHFGELGNMAHLRSGYARVLVDIIKDLGGKPFLTDANTLYVGSRKNALDHIETAYLNGFTPHTTGALGYTMYTPEEEKFLSTNEELHADLCSLLGGRAAESVVFGVKTTGASNDIQRATALARNMVALYGMSEELGLMAPAVVSNQYLDGQAHMDCSQETSAKVDAAVQKLLDSSYAEATKLLTDNRSLLDEISEFLLAKETITGEELMAYVNADKKSTPSEETEEVEGTEEA